MQVTIVSLVFQAIQGMGLVRTMLPGNQEAGIPHSRTRALLAHIIGAVYQAVMDIAVRAMASSFAPKDELGDDPDPLLRGHRRYGR